MKSYTILYNPHADNGHGADNARKLDGILADDIREYFDITQIDDYAAFFRALPNENAIVISGGDGTINRFVNDTAGVTLSNPIYYFAGGSGNDFMRDVAADHTEQLVPMEEYIVDLPTVTVNGEVHRFINGIGYGIDGYCCEEGDRQRQRSSKSVNYTAIAIKGLLFHYKPTAAVVTVDGVRHSYKKVWLVPTMNGRFYGGGMMPTPAQNRLNSARTVSTMVFHDTGKLRTLMIFPSIFKGEHPRYKNSVEILTGHDVAVEFDRPTALQIDGETVLGVKQYRVVTSGASLACDKECAASAV